MPAYWDSSAAASLCIAVQSDVELWGLYRQDPIVTWWGSELEIFGAIKHRTFVCRDARLSAAASAAGFHVKP